jgi:hypothetical protein
MQTLVRWFHRLVLSRVWLTFGLLCTCFGLFGAGTLNLFSMFSSNWDMITAQGLMALASGTLWQLFELLATLVLSLFFYVVFKVCEHSLVDRILHSSSKDRQS